MRPDSDDFALVVSAQTFELLDPANGLTVGRFVGATNAPGYPANTFAGLSFIHSQTTLHHSDLYWSKNDGEISGHSVVLAAAGGDPLIAILSRDLTNTASITMTAQGNGTVPNASSVSIDSQTGVIIGQPNAAASTNIQVANGSIIATAGTDVDLRPRGTGIGTGVLKLNGRTAFMLTQLWRGEMTSATQNSTSAAVAVTGASIVLNGLVVGDIVELSWFGYMDNQSGAQDTARVEVSSSGAASQALSQSAAATESVLNNGASVAAQVSYVVTVAGSATHALTFRGNSTGMRLIGINAGIGLGCSIIGKVFSRV